MSSTEGDLQELESSLIIFENASQQSRIALTSDEIEDRSKEIVKNKRDNQAEVGTGMSRHGLVSQEPPSAHQAEGRRTHLPMSYPELSLSGADAFLLEPNTSSAPSTPLHSAYAGRTELYLRQDISHLNRFFVRHFRISRRYPDVSFDPPTFFCETPDSFIKPLLERFHLSAALKEAQLQQLKAGLEQRASRGSDVLGLYLPGQGCFINGWLLNRGRSGEPRDLLRMPSEFPRIVAIALHENLGHGYLFHFSALGKEKTALRLQDLEYARIFDLRTGDTASEALLLQKYGLAQRASSFLEEGWSTWVESLFVSTLFQQPRGGYTLAQVWRGVDDFPIKPALKETLRSVLVELFLEPKINHDNLLQAMKCLQIIGLDPRFSRRLGRPLAYAIGSLLVDQMEAHLGLMNVPYALLIAANVTYNLGDIHTTDLASLVKREPRFNPDWRLAALSKLELPHPCSPQDIALAAQSSLNLAAPPEISSRD